MARYINPFVDFGFKYLFGREESKPFLISFLNSMLCDEPNFSLIVELNYRDKESSRTNREVKGVIYDIHCKTSNGKRFIVEMQNQHQPYFFNRILFYSAVEIVEQGIPGKDWNYPIDPVYCIAFMNYVMPGYENRFKIDVGMCDLKTKEPFNDKLRLIFIQIPLFEKKTPGECVTNFDKWMYNIINMTTMDAMAFVDDKIFEKFEKLASYANLTKEERWDYEANLKAYRDLMGQLQYAKQSGEAQGIAQGKIQEKKEMVHEMARQGLSLDLIAKIAKISVDKVKQILSNFS